MAGLDTSENNGFTQIQLGLYESKSRLKFQAALPETASSKIMGHASGLSSKLQKIYRRFGVELNATDRLEACPMTSQTVSRKALGDRPRNWFQNHL